MVGRVVALAMHGPESLPFWSVRTLDLEIRRRMLESAGLTVLDPAWTGVGLSPMDAWRPVISGNAVPNARLPVTEAGDHLDAVEERWEGLCEQFAIFGESSDFLISVAGEGATEAPWARVRPAGRMRLAHVLGPVEGEPEFVAMSIDGTAVCAVTTEEYEVWIVASRLHWDEGDVGIA